MIVEARDLWKQFGRIDSVRGASFSVPEGSAFALIGANGAGKTTTMRLLMNIITASKGNATVLGVDSRELGPKQLARIGYVSENVELPERLRVGDYVAYLRPFYPDWDAVLENTMLQQFHLPVERRIADLSHGMRMKLALLCGLAYHPKLLVLDEPFRGIDSLARDQIMEGVLRQAEDTTIIISSHDIREIEGMVTHVALLEQGRILFQDSMETLSERLREIRVTLDGEARALREMPLEWLDTRVTGNLLTFVDTRYCENELGPRLKALMGPVRNIEASPMSLRAIFTAYASAAQKNGDAA